MLKVWSSGVVTCWGVIPWRETLLDPTAESQRDVRFFTTIRQTPKQMCGTSRAFVWPAGKLPSERISVSILVIYQKKKKKEKGMCTKLSVFMPSLTCILPVPYRVVKGVQDGEQQQWQRQRGSGGKVIQGWTTRRQRYPSQNPDGQHWGRRPLPQRRQGTHWAIGPEVKMTFKVKHICTNSSCFKPHCCVFY